VQGREGGTAGSWKREGLRQKKKSSTIITISTTLTSWDTMFWVPTVLLINELRELTSQGPPISQ
jgi:hypothetical protein